MKNRRFSTSPRLNTRPQGHRQHSVPVDGGIEYLCHRQLMNASIWSGHILHRPTGCLRPTRNIDLIRTNICGSNLASDLQRKFDQEQALSPANVFPLSIACRVERRLWEWHSYWELIFPLLRCHFDILKAIMEIFFFRRIFPMDSVD